jgi:hypothetical protein
MPAADGLAVDIQSSGDFRLAQALVEESGGFEPQVFQLIKIMCNELCESQ